MSSFDLQAPFDELSTVFGNKSTRSGDAVRRTTSPGIQRIKLPSGKDIEVADQIVRANLETGNAARLEAVFDAGWKGASQIGLWLNAGQQDQGYQFVLRLGDRERKSSDDSDDDLDTVAFTFALARKYGIDAAVEIRKGGSLLLRRGLDLDTLTGDELSLMVTRQRGQLEFQLNTLPAFKV